MNAFEDLIEALKEDDLLESSVIDASPASRENSHDLTEPESGPDGGEPSDLPVIERAPNPREFFKQRAVDEVTSLQMVEHVLSGVEREYTGVTPVPFDDIKVKQALHRFNQVSDSGDTGAAAAAEHDLLEQTQGWFAALSERDNRVPVGSIRRFIENSRPALSSQAMIALARFYRNSPYTDATRSKFDLVVSRLFSREADGAKRRMLFSKVDTVTHLRTLYENWSSIEAYTHADDSGTLTEACSKFRAFSDEAAHAGSLNELLGSRFFERIREYKDGIGELFFARDVTASAIDANIRIGNRFADLVAAAFANGEVPSSEEEDGIPFDESVSDTLGRTFVLSELAQTASAGQTVTDPNEPAKASPQERRQSIYADPEPSRLAVNRWLLAAAVLIISLAVGAYFWADMLESDKGGLRVAAEIDIAATELKLHLEKAKSSNETFYGVTSPSWDALTEEEKREFVDQVFDFAAQRGLTKVNLLNYRGRTVAFATKNGTEILPPA